MKWNSAHLIPLVAKLGEFLKDGFEHYAAFTAGGGRMTPDILTIFLAQKMSSWNPQAAGKPLLDDETRAAAARFLAGVAINLAK
jgi:hypothetical protein